MSEARPFASRVAYGRQIKGLSTSAVDEAAGFEPGETARIERCESELPMRDAALKLAEVLGMSVEYLCTGYVPDP